MRKFLAFVFFLLFYLPLFSQVSDQVKEQARTYREEGYRLQNRGDLTGALRYYKKAIKVNPFYYQAYNDAGLIYVSLGNREEAIKMYKKAISLNPQYIAPYTNLALLYEEIGDEEKAAYYWKKRFLLEREGEYGWYRVADCGTKLGIYLQGKERLREKVSFLYKEVFLKKRQERLGKMNQAKLHFSIAKDLFAKKKYEEACQELKTALSLHPLDKSLQMEISEYYVKAKKAEDKDKIKIHLEEAMSYLKEEDYNSTKKKLEDALSAIFSIQN